MTDPRNAVDFSEFLQQLVLEREELDAQVARLCQEARLACASGRTAVRASEQVMRQSMGRTDERC